MKRKTVERKQIATRSLLEVAAQSDSMTPDWVVSMHDYHQKTGLYRAEDLNRVLGDPRTQVQGDVAPEMPFVCRVIGK